MNESWFLAGKLLLGGSPVFLILCPPPLFRPFPYAPPLPGVHFFLRRGPSSPSTASPHPLPLRLLGSAQTRSQQNVACRC